MDSTAKLIADGILSRNRDAAASEASVVEGLAESIARGLARGNIAAAQGEARRLVTASAELYARLIALGAASDVATAAGAESARLDESQRFQISEARDRLAEWDETAPHSGREEVLAGQVRNLLAIIDHELPGTSEQEG